MSFEAHERQRARIHALIDEVRGELEARTVDVAAELVDANEAPIALDMLSEALVECGAHVPPRIIDEFVALSRGIGLGPRLRIAFVLRKLHPRVLAY